MIDWDALEAAALEVRERAYAPYSRYRVGAALLAEDGTIFRGANVENASYGLCLCAERAAVAAAVAAGATRFSAIVVATAGPAPAAPCGMCRQVLVEFAPSFPVRCVAASGGARLETDVASLQPHAFDGSYLGADD
ncbi:MAG: cytidine deaminase [Sandaracinaceae bacterium]|nr:cytidine deaminase [Sandaracinaceae bacterium]